MFIHKLVWSCVVLFET